MSHFSRLLPLCLFAVTACAQSLSAPDEQTDQDERSDTVQRAAIVPIIIDDATMEWAANQESTFGGKIGSSAPGFREAYGAIHVALAKQGVKVAAYEVRFSDTSEDHPATQFLSQSIAFEAPVTVLSSREGGSPLIYQNALAGHSEVTSITVSDDADKPQFYIGGSRFVTPASHNPLAVTAYQALLMADGIGQKAAEEKALAAAACASLEWDGRRVLLAIDYQDSEALLGLAGLNEVTKALITELVALVDEEPIMPLAPISALEVLNGTAQIPPGAVVIVGDSKDGLPATEAGISWNGSAPVLDARIVAELMRCDRDADADADTDADK